jgi:hypothetical protein
MYEATPAFVFEEAANVWLWFPGTRRARKWNRPTTALDSIREAIRQLMRDQLEFDLLAYYADPSNKGKDYTDLATYRREAEHGTRIIAGELFREIYLTVFNDWDEANKGSSDTYTEYMLLLFGAEAAKR